MITEKKLPSPADNTDLLRKRQSNYQKILFVFLQSIVQNNIFGNVQVNDTLVVGVHSGQS